MSRSTSAPAGPVRRKATKLSLAAAVAAVLASHSASAAVMTWNDADLKNSWDLAAGTNWVGGAAWNNATPDEAVFGGTGEAITLGEPIIAGALTFNSTGYTIGNGGTAANTLTLAGATHTITVTTAGQTATISAVIDGTAGLTKAGAGTLKLSGANIYTGGTTINAGTFALGAGASLVSGSDLTFGGTSTFDLGTNTQTLGTLTLNGAITGALANGTIRVSAITFTGANATTLAGGIIDLNGAPLSINANTGTATNNDKIISSNLIGTGDITIAANGDATSANGGGGNSETTLSGSNTFTGNVKITSGIVSTASNFGNAANQITLQDGGLVANGTSTTFGRQITLAAGATGTFRSYGSTTLTLSAPITGSGNLRTTDGGTVVLAGDNTYSGTTTIGNGTLLATKAAALPGYDTAGKVIVTTGGTMAVNAGGNGQWDVGQIETLRTNATFNAGSSLGIDTTGGNFTYGSSISGAQGLRKIGANTLILSGTNSYTGVTTISGGVLSIDTLANGGANSGIGASTNAAANLSFGGGTLRYTGDTVTTDRAFTLTADSGIEVTNAATTLTVANNIAAAGGSKILTKTGSGTLVLGGSADNSSLYLSVGSGEVDLAKSGTTSRAAAGIASVSFGAIVKLTGTGGDQIYEGNAGTNYGVNGLAGTLDLNGHTEGTSNFGGTSTGLVTNSATGTNVTWTVGNTNATSAFAGTIQDGSGTIALTKTGTGTQTLTGNNTYTGVTTISGGTLQIGNGGTTGTLGAGAVTNNAALSFNRSDVITVSNAIGGTGTLTQSGSGTLTLAGTNTYTGATTVNNGGVLNLNGTLTSPVTVNAGGILSGTGSTTGTITFSNGSGILINSGGAVQGNITANAITNIFVGGAPSGSLVTADVIRYTGTAPTQANFSAAANYRSGSLTDDTVNKKITLAYQTEAKTWSATTGGTWDIGASTPWNGGDGKFYWGDSVAFGDTAADQTVTLTGNLAPSSITVSNSANTYTFSGSGAIIGAGSLTKSGNGTLIIANTFGNNTNSGDTFVNGGTLQLGNGTINGTFGTGAYSILPGATLRLNQATAVAANRPTWAKITGAGTLAVRTPGTGTTNGDWGEASLPTGFTGTLQIETGRVSTNTATSLGNAAAVVIGAGGQLGMWNGGTFSQNFTIAGTGYGETGYESALRLANSGITTTVNGTVTLSGPATVGATGTGILTNTISGASDLTFGTSSQAGTVTLRGANTYTGNTIVNAGTLALDYSVQDNSKLSDGALILGNGTTLQLAGASGSHTEIVGSVIVNGGANITRNGTNTARLALGNFTSGILNVASTGLATTTVANNASGYLDNVLFGGNEFAKNDGSGNIVAATGLTYTNLDRLGGTIPNSSGVVARIVNGGGAGNIASGVGTNDIDSLFQTATGGATTVDLTGGALRLGAKGRIVSAPGTSALTIQNGTLTAGGGAGASGTLSILNGSTNAITVNSQVTDNGAGSVGLRTAGIVTLGGANTYTGGTVINSGQLQIRNAGALGTGSVAINSGGLLSFGPSGMTVSNNVTLEGGMLSGGMDSGVVNNTYSGTLTLGAAGGTVTTWWSDKTLTLTGKITGSGNLTVDRQAAGNGVPNIVMSGTNDYTGDTMINAGVVTVSGTGVLGGGAYSGKITNAGTFNWSSTTAQAFSGQLNGSGSYSFNAGTTTLSGGGSITGALNVVPSAAGTTMSVTGGTYNIGSFSLFQNSINNATATYNQSGGAVNVSGIFELGHSTAGGSSGDTNIANFTGGTFTAGEIWLYKWANSQVNISGNATVTAGKLTLGWSDASPTGAITVGNGSIGGTLAWGDTTLNSNRAYTLSLNGGTIKATKNNASWLPAGAFTTMAVTEAGGKIDNGGFNVTVGQVISHGGNNPTDGGLAFAGVGMSTLTAANTYVGPTIVGDGTLAISGSISASTQVAVKNNGKLLLGGTSLDRIGDLASLTLGGGAGSNPATLQLDNSVGQISESVGALELASTAVLDLGTGSAGSVFHFADSSAQVWAGTLSIYNWSSDSDHLFFGNNFAGLTSAQLSSIIFYSDAGATSLGAAAFVGGGEIAPVPEPSALAMGVGMLGFLFSRRRRRNNP